jgi:hypothetical protein
MNAHVQISTAAHVNQLVKSMTLEQIVGSVRSPGYPDRVGNYQYTATGGIFFACDPRAEEIHIEDIASALSRIPRFGGNTKQFLSVAEHCWICSNNVPPEHRLAALLHDASEAYIGDLIRPIKYLPVFGSVYLKIEAGIEQKIAEKFDLTWPWSSEVRKVDERVVSVEIRDNIGSTVVNHLTDDIASRDEGAASEDIFLYNWAPELAKQFFLHRFKELTKQRYAR